MKTVTMASFLSFSLLNVPVLLPAISGIISYFIFHSYEEVACRPIPAVVLLFLGPLFLTITSTFLASSMTLSSVLEAGSLTFALYFSVILSLTVTYRLSPFHPLASYPGPVLCKISKFWLGYISLKGKQHLYYQRLHTIYGDIVRIGPNELSIIGPDSIAPMMGGGQSQMIKGPSWDGRIPDQNPHARSMISIRDGPEHTRRRRAWNRAFNAASLREYEVIVRKRATELVEMLGRHISSADHYVDLAESISYFSFDFMNDMAFGGGSEMMRSGDTTGLWHLLEKGQRLATFLGHVPWLSSYYLSMPNMGRDLKAFRAYAVQRAIHRQTQGSNTKDLYYHLMDEGGVEATPPSQAQATSDAGLAIIAGSDTTATALSNAFWHLLRNPAAHKRLQAEVDSLCDNDLMDTTHHARGMPYLNGVINEALRLNPPVISGSQRSVEKGTGGKLLGCHFLPEGTSAFIHMYSIHRDARNFYQPNEFIPERWVDEKAGVHNASAFIPFSYGTWGCVGKQLAYQEMRFVMILIVKNFEIFPAKGYDLRQWEEDLLDTFVTTRGSLPVSLRWRVQDSNN